MIRFLLRAIGLFALAGGFVAILYDGTHAIAGGPFAMTSMGDAIRKINPVALPALEAFTERVAPGWGGRTISMLLLRPPAALVLLIFGSVFLALGRTRKPKDRFAP